jgi:4-hydroxy-tetrahydrodipicolinate synthase
MSKDHRVKKYSGAITALVTPFDEKGEIDYPVFKRLLRHQVENGISGLVIGGTTGESAALEIHEILDLVESACGEVGENVPIIAGCGSNNTVKAIELTREVKDRGAVAGLSVVPYYNKPSQEGLFSHFSEIAGLGGLPIILYNVPGRTGVNLEAGTVARLALDPMISGIKEASGNLRQIEEIISTCPPDFSVISGDDGLTYSIMALGGCGVISVVSNLFPSLVSRLVNALLGSRLDEALEIHRHLNSINSALFIDTNPVPVKEAFGILGLDIGSPRLPLVPLDPVKREKLANVLKNYEADFRLG